MKHKIFSYTRTETDIDDENTKIEHELNIDLNFSDNTKNWIVFYITLGIVCIILYSVKRLL